MTRSTAWATASSAPTAAATRGSSGLSSTSCSTGRSIGTRRRTSATATSSPATSSMRADPATTSISSTRRPSTRSERVLRMNTPDGDGFTEEQKQYLDGFVSGGRIAQSLPVFPTWQKTLGLPEQAQPVHAVDASTAAQDRTLAEGKDR